MRSDSGRTVSAWMATADLPQQGPLHENVTADVCIVGGGIAGLSTAYFLTKAGQRVVLLDDGPLTGGETSRTTAHLVFYNDDGMSQVEKLHGTEGLRLASESHSAAVDAIERNVNEEQIDCDFKRLNGYLFVSPKGLGEDFLQAELDAAHRVGLTDAHWVPQAPLPAFNSGRCLCYPRQGRFHPLKYLSGLTRAALLNGARIYTQTHATTMEGGVNENGEPQARVATATGALVYAKYLVIATNTPVNDKVAIHTKQAPYRTYVIGCRVKRGSVPDNLYWDTEDPYHYVRLQELDAQYDCLIVGGEDHKTGHASDPDNRWRNLEHWARARFPQIESIQFHWSGQVMEPVDYLGYIGRNPLDADNVFIATGDSGMGMTHGTIAGLLLTDLITGKPNAWEKLYSPSRVSLKSATTYASENLDVAKQYVDLVTGGDVSSIDEIAPCSGAVIRRGLHKVAVFKDEHGRVTERSAICPHMGCVVSWNPAESTWDCPCHGSRFDPHGKVLNGPANSGLKVLDGASSDTAEPPGLHSPGESSKSADPSEPRHATTSPRPGTPGRGPG